VHCTALHLCTFICLDCIDVLAPGEDIATASAGPSSSSRGAEGGGSLLSGSSASAAIVTGFASLLFSALLDNSRARQMIAETLNEDDISTFLRVAVIYNQRAAARQAHSSPWISECSIGTKEDLLEMVFYSLGRIKESLVLNDPERPAAFNNLKRNFASFTKKKYARKYEE
jgi:hypothetical protein